MKRRQFIKGIGGSMAGLGLVAGAADPVAAGNWEWGAYSEYNYLKYTPSDGGSGTPLLVGLHGCTQEPDDFAEAIQMDYWGDQYGYSAIFPNQNDLYNGADCWNWYYDYNCDRYSGSGWEIANMYENERDAIGTDPDRGYVFGFSAGAAFTPNLIANYPDLYAAAGIHSGCEFDAADSSWGGTMAMAYGGPDPQDQGYYAYDQMRDNGVVDTVPTITFQGKDDSTVEPPNGKQCAAQAATTCDYVDGGIDRTLSEAAHSSGWDGKSYDRYEFTGNGRTYSELWRVDGLGHDWSGGSSSRYYTDPDAPEATNHMFDFFSNWSR
ncbi:alpha/beta hydrolase family esterase [Halobacteriales archaeon Cl-PHB]